MPRIVSPTALLFFCFTAVAIAADEHAPVTDNSASSVPQEPNVTIIQRGHERVEEFSMNNRVYMIKITPSKGYPYYLVDTDGDGNFDTRRPQLTSKFVIPQWVLLRWK